MPVSTTMSMSSSEESAYLLVAVDSESYVYGRFSKTQKSFIVTAVSFAGLLSSMSQSNTNYLTVLIFDFVYPAFVTGIFVPSIPQIAHDLDLTGADVRYASSPAACNSWH